jgi:hypothetical protein
LLFISLFIIYIAVFGVLHWTSSPGSGPMTAFVKAIMISSTLLFSIAFALLAKKRCDQKGKTQHAYATYSIWAAVSVIIGSLISILMNTIVNNWDLHSGFNAFVGRDSIPKAPWQLLVFATTFFTAYQLNSQESHLIDPLKLRIQEAISMSLVLCTALFFAGNMMSFTLGQFFTRGIVIIIIGFIIGYFIPTWYRGIPIRNEELIVTETEAELST